jgi:hypothetical protein
MVEPRRRPWSYALGKCLKAFAIGGSHGAAIARIAGFVASLGAGLVDGAERTLAVAWKSVRQSTYG